MKYSYEGEYIWWKNRRGFMLSANLENPQVRRSLMKVNYANYCQFHKQADINRESTEAVFKFLRGVKEKDKTLAEEGIRDGLTKFKNRLPSGLAAKIKTEEIWK